MTWKRSSLWLQDARPFRCLILCSGRAMFGEVGRAVRNPSGVAVFHGFAGATSASDSVPSPIFLSSWRLLFRWMLSVPLGDRRGDSVGSRPVDKEGAPVSVGFRPGHPAGAMRASRACRVFCRATDRAAPPVANSSAATRRPLRSALLGDDILIVRLFPPLWLCACCASLVPPRTSHGVRVISGF